MKVLSIAQYNCSQAPSGKGLTVFKTEDGWLWLRALVKREGFKTPFGSLKEIEVSQGLSNLKLISEKNIDIEIGESLMSISDLNPLGLELTSGMDLDLDSELADDD